MSQRRLRTLAMGMAAAVLVACGANAETHGADDPPKGPVSDRADILPAQEEADLDRELREYFLATGNALIVASVTSLNGKPIEEVALDTARRWQIGNPDTMRGVLIMVAPNERKVRIEVSCGLTEIVTDERAAQIIENDMIPLFKQGQLDKGTIAAAEALMKLTTDHADMIDPSTPPIACMKEAA